MKHCYVSLAVFFVCLGIALYFNLASFAQSTDTLLFAGSGIDVEANGRIRSLSKEETEPLGKLIADVLEPVPEGMDQKAALRKISFKKLDALIKTIVDRQEYLPDAVRYLGGLTNIDYIVAVPEENDLLLIGPAEGWRADTAGNVVGDQSGLPLLVLEDFLTALREWNPPASPQAITCLIEPTQETQIKLAQLHRQYTTITASNADAYAAALEEAFGDCPIKITGIPATSRFANILVGTDFKMKRIALGLESSQVRNIPSYIRSVSASRPNITPQFLLAPEYTPTTYDSKKLTWRLGDPKIRASSPAQASSGVDRAALTWCRNFEENYNALAKTQPVFGELRNTMKLALVAALIHQEKLLQKANCTLTVLLDEEKLKLVNYPQPKSVAFRSVKVQSGYSTIVACGGIEINPTGALRSNLRLDSKIDSERARLIETTGKEWWSP